MKGKGQTTRKALNNIPFEKLKKVAKQIARPPSKARRASAVVHQLIPFIHSDYESTDSEYEVDNEALNRSETDFGSDDNNQNPDDDNDRESQEGDSEGNDNAESDGDDDSDDADDHIDEANKVANRSLYKVGTSSIIDEGDALSDGYISDEEGDSSESSDDRSNDDSSLGKGAKEGKKDNNNNSNSKSKKNIKGVISKGRVQRKKPIEVSSRAPILPVHMRTNRKKASKFKTARDPRFSDTHGKLNLDLFVKSFGFLDDLHHQEKKELVDKVKKMKSQKLTEREKESLKRNLDRMKSQENHRQKLSEQWEMKKSLKSQEKEKILKFGKTPFLHSKGQIKKKVNEKKYSDMKNERQLNKHLSRKRKKQAAKERQLVPFKRRRTEEDDN